MIPGARPVNRCWVEIAKSGRKSSGEACGGGKKHFVRKRWKYVETSMTACKSYGGELGGRTIGSGRIPKSEGKG